MSAPARFWQRVGHGVTINQGSSVTHDTNTRADIYVSQCDVNREHWSVVMNVGHFPSPLEMSTSMRACDARHLADCLNAAADLLEAEAARHSAGVAA